MFSRLYLGTLFQQFRDAIFLRTKPPIGIKELYSTIEHRGVYKQGLLSLQALILKNGLFKGWFIASIGIIEGWITNFMPKQAQYFCTSECNS
ncbi:hypothetical protein MNBD_ALPHA11-1376 [hydrothermal vent metagenome]|uniref:Uncharacterized protein n=1 Tax=hydrothermal vent metagenome TaxID=652676 RepID=A0A3B0UN65_9ZZZZ